MVRRALPLPLSQAKGLVMAATIVWAAGCMVEDPSAAEPTQPLDCHKGYYEVDGQCVIRPDVVFITMTPDGSPNTVSNCPLYAPNPVSVRVRQDFMFRNTTTHSQTVYVGTTPLFTVAPGQTSPAYSFSESGNKVYYVNCGGHSTQTQTVFSAQRSGTIIVTVS